MRLSLLNLFQLYCRSLFPGHTVPWRQRQRLATLASIQMSAGVSVASTGVHFAEAVKLLGVTLDPVLTFNQHVTDVVRACMYHTRALRHIRSLLTVAAAKSIATSIVGARLDYCNSLLYGTSECNLDRLSGYT